VGGTLNANAKNVAPGRQKLLTIIGRTMDRMPIKSKKIASAMSIQFGGSRSSVAEEPFILP